MSLEIFPTYPQIRTEQLSAVEWDKLPDLIALISSIAGSADVQQHRTAPVLDHPDGSVTAAKLAPGAAAGNLEQGNIYFNSDWNNYTTPGYYQVSDGGSSPANTPPTSYPYGLLAVIKAGTAIIQLYIQHTGRTFVRQAWGEAWEPWVELSNNFENRFVLQGNVGGGSTVSIDGGAYIDIARTVVNVPTGKRLYLKRIRSYLYNTLRPYVTVASEIYVGPEASIDVELDLAMTSPGPLTHIIRVGIHNPTGGSSLADPYESVWAEFEIR